MRAGYGIEGPLQVELVDQQGMQVAGRLPLMGPDDAATFYVGPRFDLRGNPQGSPYGPGTPSQYRVYDGFGRIIGTGPVMCSPEQFDHGAMVRVQVSLPMAAPFAQTAVRPNTPPPVPEPVAPTVPDRPGPAGTVHGPVSVKPAAQLEAGERP